MTAQLRKCPCCRQIIPPPIGVFDGSPVKKRIYEFIVRHPQGVGMSALMDHVYSLDPAGGPESPNVISAHISMMRKVLAKTGLTIVTPLGRGMGATYRVVPIANVNTSKPVLKAPGGSFGLPNSEIRHSRAG